MINTKTKKQHTHPKQLQHKTTHDITNNTIPNTTSNRTSKFGIVLLGIGILAVAIVGYSYYDGSKQSNASNNTTVTATTTTKGGGGCGMMNNNRTITTTPTPVTTDPNINYETVNVGHDEYSLVPEVVTLTAGKSYKLIIMPTADGQGCMNNMTIPGIDENVYDIKKGQSISIVINNAKAGNYNVVCGNMGMYKGKIVVQ